MELVRKGEEKLAFDHPTPIQIARYLLRTSFAKGLWATPTNLTTF
jgi:hypothetical protein